MRLRVIAWTFAAAAASVLSTPTHGTTITFDDLQRYSTSYGFDGDGDGIDEVRFSTTDPFGFNPIGPGPNQQYINEPALEGNAQINPDLRVDFAFGATGNLQFGFAVGSRNAVVPEALTFRLFDASGNLLGLARYTAIKGSSNFPEAMASMRFVGAAAYGTFDFADSAGRYIIDNFSGSFGSPVSAVPEPALWAMLVMGFALTGGIARRPRYAQMTPR